MKTIKIKYPLAFFFIILCLPKSGYSQAISATNIHWRLADKKIEVFYDLPGNKDTIEVKIYFHKESNPAFSYSPRTVKGSIGKGVFSGKGKKIVWSTKNEPASLFTGGGFYFKILINKIPEKKD